MAFSLDNLLDVCSEFTRGQPVICDIKPSRHKMKKSKSNNVSREEKEFADYIGYQKSVIDADRYGDCSSASDDQYSRLSPSSPVSHLVTNSYQKGVINTDQYEDSYSASDYQYSRLSPSPRVSNFDKNCVEIGNDFDNIPPNNFGMGRGKFFGQQYQLSMPSKPRPARRNLQEVNDRIIGEQLREMGIAVSNDDIEAEFHKKFKIRSSPVENIVTNADCQKKSVAKPKPKHQDQPLYMPPHMRTKSTCGSSSNSSIKNDETESPVLSASAVSTVYDAPIENDNKVAFKGGASESKNIELTQRDLRDDSISFCKKNSVENDNKVAFKGGASESKNIELTQRDLRDDSISFCKKNSVPQLIQFKIKSNDVNQLSAKVKSGRNVLISGLLKRRADEEKLQPLKEESDVKVGSSIAVESIAEESSYKNDQANPHDAYNDSSNIKFDAMNGCYFMKPNTINQNVKSVNSSCSQTSSRSSSTCSNGVQNNDHIDQNQPLYFTAPVSKKIVPVTVSKTFIDIMSNNDRKRSNSTFGDYISVSENKLSQSSARSTPSLNLEMGSALNPHASEFSPKSTHSRKYSSSDGDSFCLDNEEFPPL